MTTWWTKIYTWGTTLGMSSVLIAGIFFGVSVLVGECSHWRDQNKTLTQPVAAPPTKIEERSPTVLVHEVTVKALDPAPKVRKKLEEKYHVELPAPAPGEKPEVIILGEREIQSLPAGGTILLTMNAATGETTATVVANPEKFFKWESTWEIGGVYGYGASRDERWRAWVAYEPLRAGRFHLRIEAGAEFRMGIQDSYAMAGVVWRSR